MQRLVTHGRVRYVQVLLGRVHAGAAHREPHHPAGHHLLLHRRLQSSLGRLLRRFRRRSAPRRPRQLQNRYTIHSFSLTLTHCSVLCKKYPYIH